MISEREKQAILNGAYGITREGKKVKYVGKREPVDEHSDYPHFFVVINQKGEITRTLCLSEDFTHYLGNESDHSVVGLWENRLESFDLERALAGEPVMTRDRSKAYVQTQISQPKGLEHYSLIGFGYNGEHKEFLHWDETGKVMADDDSCDDIIGMWQEPKPAPNTVTLTLPCPLKEPKDDMWYISSAGIIHKSSYNKGTPMYWEESFNAGFYFGSESDAQMWLDAMRDNRR